MYTISARAQERGRGVRDVSEKKGRQEMRNDKTQTFNLKEEREKEIRTILQDVYEALKEKGYNPINQIVGYILSEDPTYITNHNNARSLICRIDRDELMNMLVRYYLDV